VQRRFILEISVESAEAAAAAERGGAQRIELCSDLSVGGLTPGNELFLAVRQQVAVPIFSMVRPRAGDFAYSGLEFSVMKEDIVRAKTLGADGIVLGILQSDQRVDVTRTQELVQLAHPLPVTFHRAFDECRDEYEGLEDVLQAGAKRILTSGSAPSAVDGVWTLGELVKYAGEQIVIVPGAGINAGNLKSLVEETGAREFHSGLSSVIARPVGSYEKFEEEVRGMVRILSEMS
jgi:copper homeostasis protein